MLKNSSWFLGPALSAMQHCMVWGCHSFSTYTQGEPHERGGIHGYSDIFCRTCTIHPCEVIEGTFSLDGAATRVRRSLPAGGRGHTDIAL